METNDASSWQSIDLGPRPANSGLSPPGGRRPE